MKQLPLQTNPPGNKARTLDSLGTELWNVSAGLINETQGDPRPKATNPVRQGVLVRVFAFLLLDAANSATSRASQSKSEELQTRTLTIALRTARLCLEKDELPLAMKVLERCKQNIPDGQDEEHLMQMTSGPVEQQQTFESILKGLTSEFYLLRLLHAWKSSRLDLADHYYPQVILTGTSPTSSLQVKAADLFYEIARAFAKLGKQDDAVKWFERAFGVWDQVNPECVSQEGAELRLSIGVSFGKSSTIVVGSTSELLQRTSCSRLITHLTTSSHGTSRECSSRHTVSATDSRSRCSSFEYLRMRLMQTLTKWVKPSRR